MFLKLDGSLEDILKDFIKAYRERTKVIKEKRCTNAKTYTGPW